ncbi:MAG: hypothetical protein ACTSYS_04725 [Promethearchaeota archaeon]
MVTSPTTTVVLLLIYGILELSSGTSWKHSAPSTALMLWMMVLKYIGWTNTEPNCKPPYLSSCS